MRLALLCALALSFFIVSATEVFAVGGDHQPGKITQEYNKEWPAALPDLINSMDRVGGHWVNQGDFFYYRGNAGELNKFLAGYGKLTNTPLSVVIHTGTKALTGPLGGEQKTPYDWQVEVMRRGWGAPLDPRLSEKEPGYVVTIHLWLSDSLPLERLEIPKHVEVRSAGDIERFITTHRDRIR